MNGSTIDNVVVGGPAHNCSKLFRGDVIVKVDGNAVNDDNILEILVGDDVPGSAVQLGVAKGGKNVRPRNGTSWLLVY
jgi:S1-C subfamily serine protease